MRERGGRPGTIPGGRIETSFIVPWFVATRSLSLRGERLVAAGRGGLAAPLLELGAGAGRVAGHVQAQAAVFVLELPCSVGQADRQPQPVGRAVLRVLDHRGAGRSRGSLHDDVRAAVLVLQLPIAAGDRVELELLIGLTAALARPLDNRRAVAYAPPGHINAQAAVLHHELVVAGRIAAARTAAGSAGERLEGAAEVPGGLRYARAAVGPGR